MKIKGIAIALVACIGSAFAQDTDLDIVSVDDVVAEAKTGSLSFTSKNGFEVLPQAGDWGVGIGATPILALVGNVFGDYTGGNENAFSFSNQGTNILYGKYFVTSDLAYRAILAIDYNRAVIKANTQNNVSVFADDFVTDVFTTTQSGVTIGAGLEKRKGAGRLVGVYGAQAFIQLGYGVTRSADYGNDFSLAVTEPTSSIAFQDNVIDFENAFPDEDSLAESKFPTVSSLAPAPDPVFNAHRIVETKSSSAFGIGAQAFIGVEYYFAPKMSLGGEFSWGINYVGNLKASTTSQRWEPTTNEIIQETIEVSGGSIINAGVGNLGGTLNLMFYF